MGAAIRGALVAIVAIGLANSAWLSWGQFQSGKACPLLGPIPACYVALCGYGLLAFATIKLVVRRKRADRAFWSGWAIAAGLATLGSVMEIARGDICPRIAKLPLCYVSLASCVLIALLYRSVRRRVDVASSSLR